MDVFLTPPHDFIFYHNGNVDFDANQRKRNIRLTLIFTVLVNASRSMWSQSVLSTYVFLMCDGSAKAVGSITASMGISQLIISLPVGYIVDRYRRDTMLKIASLLGMFSIVLAFIAISHQSYTWLTAALLFWGAYRGTTDTSLQAILADSIREGESSVYFTQRSMCVNAGNVIGPATTLLLFAFFQDEWNIRVCSIVIIVGNALCIPTTILLCFFRDVHASDEKNVTNNIAPVSVENYSSMEEDFQIKDNGILSFYKKWKVPLFIASSNVLAGVGSGMSIRYFPVFFYKSLNLSPVVVQVLYITAHLGGMGLKYVSQKVSQRLGRCCVAILFKWIGVLLMFIMILSYYLDWPVLITCIFYLLRTLFMNSTSPLTKSVLMDAVPKNSRGRWSAVDSVYNFSWSGSAALGGILVEWNGLLFNFMVTAGIQFFATLPLVSIFLARNDHIENVAISEKNISSSDTGDYVNKSSLSYDEISTITTFDEEN